MGEDITNPHYPDVDEYPAPAVAPARRAPELEVSADSLHVAAIHVFSLLKRDGWLDPVAPGDRVRDPGKASGYDARRFARATSPMRRRQPLLALTRRFENDN